MQYAKIVQLFMLFANLPHISGNADYVDAAAAQVRAELRPDADPDDIRLCYYAAAVANLQYRRSIAAQGALSPTYAGTVTARRDDTVPCSLAERLAAAYRRAASDLLSENAAGCFVFRGIR